MEARPLTTAYFAKSTDGWTRCDPSSQASVPSSSASRFSPHTDTTWLKHPADMLIAVRIGWYLALSSSVPGQGLFFFSFFFVALMVSVRRDHARDYLLRPSPSRLGPISANAVQPWLMMAKTTLCVRASFSKAANSAGRARGRDAMAWSHRPAAWLSLLLLGAPESADLVCAHCLHVVRAWNARIDNLVG